ncbi:MAG: hypothetical protein ACJAZO_004963 [Myxococcota bacterium]|jgi:hypothetical protein
MYPDAWFDTVALEPWLDVLRAAEQLDQRTLALEQLRLELHNAVSPPSEPLQLQL